MSRATRKERSMDAIRHELVTIRQTALRDEADAVRLAATLNRPTRKRAAADAAARQPLGALRRLLGGATGFVAASE